jgi:hypothetical protein
MILGIIGHPMMKKQQKIPGLFGMKTGDLFFLSKIFLKSGLGDYLLNPLLPANRHNVHTLAHALHLLDEVGGNPGGLPSLLPCAITLLNPALVLSD